MAAKVEPFWIRKTLDQLDPQEWESLCDGCGLCCLQKLEDEDDNSVYYTRIACKLLDLKTCQCTDYPNRRDFVPDCIQLTPGKAEEFRWLPRPAVIAWSAKARTCRCGTTWCAAIAMRCTTNVFPSPGACLPKAAWPKTIGKTI